MSSSLVSHKIVDLVIIKLLNSANSYLYPVQADTQTNGQTDIQISLWIIHTKINMGKQLVICKVNLI